MSYTHNRADTHSTVTQRASERCSTVQNIQLLWADVPVGKEAAFSINTVDAGPGQAKLSVVSPSGQLVPAAVEPKPEGFTGKFIPQEVGPQTVHVQYADQPVPGSPFHITATQVWLLQLHSVSINLDSPPACLSLTGCSRWYFSAANYICQQWH